MLRLAIAILFLAWSAPLVADTYPRQPGVDAVRYVFRLALVIAPPAARLA